MIKIYFQIIYNLSSNKKKIKMLKNKKTLGHNLLNLVVHKIMVYFKIDGTLDFIKYGMKRGGRC